MLHNFRQQATTINHNFTWSYTEIFFKNIYCWSGKHCWQVFKVTARRIAQGPLFCFTVFLVSTVLEGWAFSPCRILFQDGTEAETLDSVAVKNKHTALSEHANLQCRNDYQCCSIIKRPTTWLNMHCSIRYRNLMLNQPQASNLLSYVECLLYAL